MRGETRLWRCDVLRALSGEFFGMMSGERSCDTYALWAIFADFVSLR